jgi:TonB family protein
VKPFLLQVVLILSCCIFYNNTNAQVDIRKEKVYTTVDRMPCFIECENNRSEKDRRACCDKEVKEFMLDHLVYPSQAKRENLEGTVIIRFIVDKDGTVIEPEIVSDIGRGCGVEALRVINLMPRWETPGMQANQKVPVQFDLPVRFSLDEKDRPRGKTTAKDIATAAVILGGFIYAAKKINDKNRKKKNKNKNKN